MINYEYPPLGGGAGIACRNLLRALAGRADITVDLLTSSSSRGVSVEEFAPNIKIHRIGIRKQDLHRWRKSEVIEWLFKAGAYHKRLLKVNSYDLTHCFFAFPSGFPAWLTRSKQPYIVSLRGSDVPGYNDKLGLDYMLLSPLFRSIWNSAAAVVANSSGLRELAGSFFDMSRIAVIPNGVDRAAFPLEQRHFTGGKLDILMVVRFVYRKRVDLAIEAIRVLREKGIKATLNLVGSGELEEQLKVLAGEKNACGYVNFLGALEHSALPDIYRANDIYLMCSESEGMSNSLLEAISTGMPVVSSACQGSGELVRANGIIVPRQDARMFADALERFVEEADLYERCSRAADELTQSFSTTANAKSYLELYREICSTPFKH